MIIVIEGGDGCGKSTIGKAVAELLDCPLIEFPDDKGYTGSMIRDYLGKRWLIDDHDSDSEGRLKQGNKQHMEALAFQSLQIANRMERMEEIKRADNIVLVRYWQSGVVYGTLDGLDRDWLINVHKPMVQADLNILLDVTAETSLERQKSRGEEQERYEGAFAFTKKVNDSYRELWEDYSSQWSHISPWQMIDANKSHKQVEGDVFKCIISQLNRKIFYQLEHR